MAATPLLGCLPNGNIAAGNTSFEVLSMGEIAPLATETNVQITFRTAGTLSKLLINIVSNDRAASTFRSRKGGVGNANLVNSSISGTGEFVDNTNTDAVTAGDLWNATFLVGLGGTVFTPGTASWNFSATTNTAIMYCNINGPTYVNNGVTIFKSLTGNEVAAAPTTEAQAQSKFRTAGTLKNVHVFILTNTRTTTSTIRSRVNGGYGNLSVPYTTLQTGIKEDTANSDTIASGDLVNSSVDMGASAENFRFRDIKYEFITTNSSWDFFGGRYDGDTVSSGTTYYLAIGGYRGTALDTSEARVTLTANLAFTASNLRAYVSANTITGNSTLKLFAGGSALNQTVTLTGAATNQWFEDVSNSDVITSSQKLSYQIIGGAGGTSLTIHTIGMLSSPTATSSTWVGYQAPSGWF